MAIGLWECQSGPSVHLRKQELLWGRGQLQGQSAACALWKSRIKCTKNAAAWFKACPNQKYSIGNTEELMIDRETAWCLLTEFTQSESLRKHALSVEACMRACASKFADGSPKR